MIAYLAIFLGGGIGSILRFGISQWYVGRTTTLFPTDTLTANFLATLFLGLLWIFISENNDYSQTVRLFFMTGLCGGFSTFSTFSLETMQLLQEGRLGLAALYVFASVASCLLVLYLLLRILGPVRS